MPYIYNRKTNNDKKMKQIIRLTESDLHNIIRHSVNQILREEDNSMLLQIIAQALSQKEVYARDGENEEEVELGNGAYAYITYEVSSSPYMERGWKSHTNELPNDPDEVVDSPSVYVNGIEYCENDEECIELEDNGIIKDALENTIVMDYGDDDIPYSDEYFNVYDDRSEM